MYCHSSLALTMGKDFSSWANLPTHRSLKVIHSRVKCLLAFRLHAPKIFLTTESWTSGVCRRHLRKSKKPYQTQRTPATVIPLPPPNRIPECLSLPAFLPLSHLLGSHDHVLQASHKLSLLFLPWNRVLFLKCNKMKQSLSDFQNHMGKRR